MSDAWNPWLIDHVAQVGSIDAADVAAMATEAELAYGVFQTQYADFTNGRWQSAVLFNPSGRMWHHSLVDGEGRPTELAARVPRLVRTIDRVANSFGIKVSWARLALMLPNAEVWEHRDFLELGMRDRARLHLPLCTNEGARLHFPGASVHLASGYVWHLDTDIPHAASNDGPMRVHLILDCYDANRIVVHSTKRWLDESLIHVHPELDGATFTTVLDDFCRRLAAGEVENAEHHVLMLFRKFNLKGSSSYKVLATLYRSIGDNVRANHWLKVEADKLGSRTG